VLMMALVLQVPSSWEYSQGPSIQACHYLAVELPWMRHCCWAFRALVAIVPCGRIGPSLDSDLESFTLVLFLPDSRDFGQILSILVVVVDAI
jgi:hypothetical protein